MGDSRKQVLDEERASKYLMKSVENRLHLKRRLYYIQLQKGISISNHINICTKLLTNLANVDAVIEDEGTALILLSSLLDERYEIFVLTLINGRTSLSYSVVTTALVNLELKRKDTESSSSNTSAEVLTAGGSSPNRRR